MSHDPRPGLRLLAVVAALVATLGLLELVGGRLPGPALAAGGGPAVRWAGAVDPAGVTIGVVHAVAAAGVVYLLAAAVLEAALSLGPRCSRRTSAARRRRVRLPWASTVVRRAAGLGLAISLGAGVAVPAGAGATARSTVVMRLEEPTAAPVMHLVTSVQAPAHHLVWTIRPGDHLWKVAGQTLALARGRRADDAAVLAYVREIVRANADVFVVPGDPDLVYPGQRFVLPPVPVI
jgi:nucleoid-associated protein YgaU